MSVPLADLRVVVLSYGTGGECGPLLTSLLDEGVAPERILVVHNPSTPDEGPPPVPAGCEVLRAAHNLGYAAGMNLGVECQLEHDPELLLLLTHDARLRSGALAALVEAAAMHPSCGVLGPVLLFSGTDEVFSYGGRTGKTGGTAHRSVRPEARDGIAACDWVDGGTMLVRAEVLRSVGSFDERFWGYFEEADLCWRAVRAGFGVAVALAARADQEPGGGKRPGAWAYLLTRNGIAYARRVAGTRGVRAAVKRAARESGIELMRAIARLAGLRRGSPAEQWAVAVGTARGALDYFRGRWGPPPALPGSGDVSNVAARRGGADDD